MATAFLSQAPCFSDSGSSPPHRPVRRPLPVGDRPPAPARFLRRRRLSSLSSRPSLPQDALQAGTVLRADRSRCRIHVLLCEVDPARRASEPAEAGRGRVPDVREPGVPERGRPWRARGDRDHLGGTSGEAGVVRRLHDGEGVRQAVGVMKVSPGPHVTPTQQRIGRSLAATAGDANWRER